MSLWGVWSPCFSAVALGLGLGLSLRRGLSLCPSVLFGADLTVEAATLCFTVSLSGFMTLSQFFFWLINK